MGVGECQHTSSDSRTLTRGPAPPPAPRSTSSTKWPRSAGRQVPRQRQATPGHFSSRRPPLNQRRTATETPPDWDRAGIEPALTRRRACAEPTRNQRGADAAPDAPALARGRRLRFAVRRDGSGQRRLPRRSAERNPAHRIGAPNDLMTGRSRAEGDSPETVNVRTAPSVRPYLPPGPTRSHPVPSGPVPTAPLVPLIPPFRAVPSRRPAALGQADALRGVCTGGRAPLAPHGSLVTPLSYQGWGVFGTKAYKGWPNKPEPPASTRQDAVGSIAYEKRRSAT